jgi:hypothetical protein
MHVVAHRIRLDRIVLFTTACACALSPRHTVAQSTEAPRVAQGGSVVSTVQIERENVFDKSENSSWLARTMNKLHIVTREYVVKRELLVQEAQPYDSATAAETERNLRKLGIFRDVKIDSATTANGLTAHVTTQDSWTTQLYTSFKSGGNEITWGIGLTEKNFLGSQIKASVRYISDPDRSTTQFGVAIPRVWRNRLNLSAQYNELSDGSNARFTVAAPFTSQSTPRSLTLDAYYNDGDVLRFFEGESEASDTVRHLLSKLETNAGWAERGSPEGYVRLVSTLQFRREDFSQGTIAKEDRSFFGEVEVGVDASKSTFAVIHGYRALGGREDVDLSRTIHLGVWVAPSAWGYERTGFGPSVTVNLGKEINKGFVLGQIRGSSLFTRTGLDSGSVVGSATLALQPAPKHSVVLNASGGMQKNPYPGEEFDLGLTFGPRGFPSHAFTGDRAFFTSAEYRWVAADNLFGLVGVGVAAFGDYGGAWYTGSPTRTGTDVGVGIRLGSTRSASGKAATRIDLARRFANDVLGDAWVVAVGAGFPFDRGGK